MVLVLLLETTAMMLFHQEGLMQLPTVNLFNQLLIVTLLLATTEFSTVSGGGVVGPMEAVSINSTLNKDSIMIQGLGWFLLMQLIWFFL